MTRKAKKKPEPSPARQLITLVYHETPYRSRINFDHARQAAVRLAVEFGLRFDLDDVKWLKRSTINDQESKVRADFGEMEYAIACGRERGCDNASAAQSYEHAIGRKPFLVAQPGVTTRQRVYVGLRFNFEGMRVTCTSFAKDGESFIATKSSYQDGGRAKVEKRIRVTRETLADWNRKLSKAGKAVAQ